jgi:hypothetical protein
MRRSARHTERALWLAAAWLLVASTARAQDSLLIACGEQGACSYQRVYAPTVTGNKSVRLVRPDSVNDAQALRKAQSVRLDSLPALYRDPQSGLLRVVNDRWQLGNIVLPSKLPQGATTAAAALAGSTIDYQKQAKGKARLSFPIGQFVALFSGPRLEQHAAEFLSRTVLARESYPRQSDLAAGAVTFLDGSSELRALRDDLRGTMRKSLDAFRSGGADPTRLEATLEAGLLAMKGYQLVAAPAEKEEALQHDLVSERRRLDERFAIAMAFKNAQLHDAYLNELDQLGLARWSRREVVAGVQASLEASKQLHYDRADEQLKAKRYAQAFDEARLASRRAPCDEKVNNLYRNARSEFVNHALVLAMSEYDKEYRVRLQQVVRDLDMAPSVLAKKEGRDLAMKRIKDGEELDASYLPLRFKKAEVFANLLQYTSALEVVADVERNVALDRAESERWLGLDSRIYTELLLSRQRTEKAADELVRNQQFKEALDVVAVGLDAEPANLRLLYMGAVAAAVLRDQQVARRYVDQYFRTLVLPCAGGAPDTEQTLFELYRGTPPDAGPSATGTKAPNWMSGALYDVGEVFYDPVSGSFQQRVAVSLVTKGPSIKSTSFTWDGYKTTVIETREASRPGDPARRVAALEPQYDAQRVYMKGIGTAPNSSGQRTVLWLRYLTSPDYDPQLAAKLAGKALTRGWAGNPFFHPFLWNDIFLFDFEYDDLGRISKATPVSDVSSRPSSGFSEPLTFKWDGRTSRLVSITGKKYTRLMTYDDRGRLIREDIRYQGGGEGQIEYEYVGKTMQLLQATCKDDFYDKAQRVISFEARER